MQIYYTLTSLNMNSFANFLYFSCVIENTEKINNNNKYVLKHISNKQRGKYVLWPAKHMSMKYNENSHDL